MNKNRFSLRKIADECGISKSSCGNIINEPNNKKIPEKLGRKTKYEDRYFRTIERVVMKKPYLGARRINGELAIKSSPSTICRLLRKHNFAKKSLKKRPKLSKKIKKQRIEYCSEILVNSIDTEKWIFTDEKKFKFNGANGYYKYRHNLNNPGDDKYYSTDYHNFRGVMVWMGISTKGILHIERISGTMNGLDYGLLATGDAYASIHSSHGSDFSLLQDNAPCHKSKIAKRMMEESEISLVNHPPLSPDLNPIEQVWALLARMVYERKTTYENEEELWLAIKEEANKINKEKLISFIKGLKNKMLSIIINNDNMK